MYWSYTIKLNTSNDIDTENPETIETIQPFLETEIILIDVDNENNINTTNQNHYNDDDWDVLVFTQQWPITSCYQWREMDKSRVCLLPKQEELWTIHGIWPTKIGEFGPFFCEKNATFNPEEIEDLHVPLNLYWPDIYNETDSNSVNWLWEHEWLKHGTCARTLPALNNEHKYFMQAIKWSETYHISNIFDNASIYPNSNNTVYALYKVLHQSLGINPSIHCFNDIHHNVILLEEIRLCFNKNLALVDCDGVKGEGLNHIEDSEGTIITNCPTLLPIYYPAQMIPL